MANTIPTDPREWTLDTVRQVLAAQKKAAEDKGVEYEVNKALVEKGDHWQNGLGYVGPAESLTSSTDAEKVKRQWVVVDAIREALGNFANGLLKREASITLQPLEPIEPAEGVNELSDAQQSELEKIEREGQAIIGDLSAWWDRVRLWEEVAKAAQRSRWATWSTLRMFVPAKFAVAGTPRVSTLADALRRIQVEAPLPENATVYTVPETQEKIGVVLTTDENDEPVAEVWFVNEAGNTVARDIKQGDARDFDPKMTGGLPIAQMVADLLITPAVWSQQKRLNYAESIQNRCIETAGFRERYIANASPVGRWTRTKPANRILTETDIAKDLDGETIYFEPEPLALGAGKSTQMRGFPVVDDTVHPPVVRGVTTPTVTFADPVDPDFAIKTAFHARRTILESCHQGHILADSSAAPSGYSREQARAAFEDDLDKAKTPLEGMLRDFLTAVLALAEAMGAPPVLDRYRVQVELHINSGPLSPEEQSEIRSQWEKGMISAETALALLGIEDVQAELERIKNSEEAQLALTKKRAEVLQLLGGFLPWEAAAKLAGFSDAEIREALSMSSDTGFDDDETVPPQRQAGSGRRNGGAGVPEPELEPLTL